MPGAASRAATGKHDGKRMNMKRMRGRNHRGGGAAEVAAAAVCATTAAAYPLNRNHVFDSNGPDVRVRGTAQQLFEKYLQLGRDATSGGDRVTAESYFQHAEHYFRILNAMNQAAQQNQQNGQRARAAGASSRDRGGRRSRQANGATRGGGGRIPGIGDQPDAREIPIAAAPPES